MTRPLSRPAVATLFALALAAATLGGCAGALGTTEPLDAENSPLTRYLMEIYGETGYPVDGTQEEKNAYFAEQQNKVENLVAECMTAEGFDYVPQTTDASAFVSDDGDTPWKPDDRDWVTKYGYGLVNNPWSEETEEPIASEGPADPNQTYVDKLPEAEQRAYQEALWGKQDTEESVADADQFDWTKQGCYDKANHEVQGDMPWDNPENESIMQAIEKFYETMGSNEAYAEINAEWSECMTEAGHGGFAKQPEAEASISKLVEDYYNQAGADEGTEQPEAFGTLDDPEFAKIADAELPLALADLDCREKTDYRQRELKAQFAEEEQFLADHAAELEAFKASAKQAGN